MRIIIVDDTASDRDLAERVLRAEFPSAVLDTSVRDEAQFDARLDAETWDVAVLDYQLRWSDGITLLKRVKAVAPGCAAILFTSSGNEQVAAEALRCGADDYVIKRAAHFSLLAHAVRRALDKAEAIRRRERAERELAKTVEALEQANRLKDEFLANVSHELRTPLNAIAGWAAILKLGRAAPEEIRSIGARIERNVRMQAKLVSDLLDLSRIMSGGLPLQLYAVRIEEIIDAALQTVSVAARDKGVTIEKRVDANVPAINADAMRMEQVVTNLVDNAVKFTPAGGRVEIAVTAKGPWLRCVVTDTGQGIAPDFLPNVFSRFRQQEGATTRKHGGTGLGLSIARHLVELHGGRIEAFSAGEGTGTAITVELPISTSAVLERRERDRESPAPEVIRLDGFRLLVVDDQADTLEAVARLLREHGALVEAAATAEEAYERITAASPQLLISDIGLPGEDGYALLKRVRAHEQASGRAPLPAIALTAYAGIGDRARALDAGYQEHLPKPVAAEALLARIAALLGADRSP